jgi:PAS domain S-box-containing protein
VDKPSLTVARVMAKLARALADLEKQPTLDRSIRARAETLLEQAADMPVALLIANNSGRYVDVNEPATRLTGFTHSELLRMSVWDLTPTASAAAGRRMWQEFLRAGRLSGSYTICRKSGGKVRADFRAWANVLPGVHVSALATPTLLRGPKAPSRRKAR